MKQLVVYMIEFDSLLVTDPARGFKIGQIIELEIGGVKLGKGTVVGHL